MKRFICYERATGKITKIVSCAAQDIALNVVDEEAYLEHAADFDVFDDTHYVDLATLKVTEKMFHDMVTDLTLQVGQRQVIPLPETCLVGCESDEAEVMFEVDDGTLELEFALPGEYQLTIESIHYHYPKVAIHVQEN